MTLEKSATVDISEIDGPFDAKHVGAEFTKTLEGLNLKEGRFRVAAAILGAVAVLPNGEPVPEDSFALTASVLQLGGGDDERDEDLVRAFGMFGVELLNRGFSYPSLLHMVESADKAVNDGRHGSISLVNGDELIKTVMGAAGLASVDDENIPQA